MPGIEQTSSATPGAGSVTAGQLAVPAAVPAAPAEGAEAANVNALSPTTKQIGRIQGNAVRTSFTMAVTIPSINFVAQVWKIEGTSRKLVETQPKLTVVEGGVLTIVYAVAPAAKEEHLIIVTG